MMQIFLFSLRTLGYSPLDYRLNDVDKMLMTYMSRDLCLEYKKNSYNSIIKTNSPTKN